MNERASRSHPPDTGAPQTSPHTGLVAKLSGRQPTDSSGKANAFYFEKTCANVQPRQPCPSCQLNQHPLRTAQLTEFFGDRVASHPLTHWSQIVPDARCDVDQAVARREPALECSCFGVEIAVDTTKACSNSGADASLPKSEICSNLPVTDRVARPARHRQSELTYVRRIWFPRRH